MTDSTHVFQEKMGFILHVLNLFLYMLLKYDQNSNLFGVWDQHLFLRLEQRYFKRIKEMIVKMDRPIEVAFKTHES